MPQEMVLGRVAGLQLSTMPSALVGMVALGALGGVVAWRRGATPGAALRAGLGLVAVHWTAELWHQGGHAWAARRLGHPMIGVRLWGLLSASVYPPDEPDLPATVHVRRALGGPASSSVLGVAAGLLALALRPCGGLLPGLALALALDSLLVMSIGAVIPLGFNDGSTLLTWWSKQ